jgi:phage minor structural protein
LQKAKIIEPQTLQGATADTATTKALEGTEWRKGKVDYNGIRTLKIEEYTNPYSLLKRIASEFGLDLRFRVAVEENKIVRYVDLLLPDDEFDGKEVVFGKDLIGLRRIEDAQNIVTALLVLGPEQEDGTRLTVLVENNDALQRWGRNGQHLIEVYEPQITAEDVTIERLRTLGQNALQKSIDALVKYECQAAVLEHITGKEHEKVRLDRTIRIKDEGYTPPLYLEAKVLEIKEQPSTGKILDFKLGNYKEYSKADLESQISTLKKQLTDRLSKLVQITVTSSAGTVFKNGTGETDLTAVTILGGKEVDTDGLFYSYVWSIYDKNGNFVGATSGKSITVYARNIDEKETYIVTVENDGAKSIGQITVTNVNDGEDSWKVEVISTNGFVFKKGVISTVLKAKVYKGGTDVTDIIDESKFRWTRVSDDSAADKIWNDKYFGGRKTITITTEDVKNRATFFCEIID